MTPLLKPAVLACALLAPAVTSAQLTLGARGGVAFPLGDQVKDASLKGRVERAYPLEVTAGWKLTPEVEVGLQGGYAFASPGSASSDECRATGSDCKVHLWNVAVRGEYVEPLADVQPFFAASLGGEWEVDRQEVGSENWERRTRGGWLAGIEAGAYVAAAKWLDLGAFLGVSLGQYRWQWEKGQTAGYAHSDAGGIQDPAVHGWFTVGLRGRFVL
ncbi:MAG TPA: hypothetical protein VLT47_01290 [Anaeromyxobacteraceae bacterium]|nr:hypothetical protein [Anaeromyxobacteraceae bacterium]